MAGRAVKRYSLSFKKRVVQDYEAGASVSSLMRKYGITGKQTISNWVNRYSEKGSGIGMKRISEPPVQAEVETLKEKVDALEKLVAQLSLDKFMLESCLKVAEDELGYPVKKSDDTTPSGRRSRSGRRDR